MHLGDVAGRRQIKRGTAKGKASRALGAEGGSRFARERSHAGKLKLERQT